MIVRCAHDDIGRVAKETHRKRRKASQLSADQCKVHEPYPSWNKGKGHTSRWESRSVQSSGYYWRNHLSRTDTTASSLAMGQCDWTGCRTVVSSCFPEKIQRHASCRGFRSLSERAAAFANIYSTTTDGPDVRSSDFHSPDIQSSKRHRTKPFNYVANLGKCA